jgi:hypothetical protein
MEPEGSLARCIEAQTSATSGGKGQGAWFWLLCSQNFTGPVLDTLTDRKEIVGDLILTEPDEAASRFD